ncbi:MAG: right-handed parallel beta-helix repeat-containing protein, partial [bacterium]
GECGAGIGADETGGFDPKTGKIVYHLIEGNYVNGAANAAIGCRCGDSGSGYVRIISNEVTGAGRKGMGSGIGLNGVIHASEISHNFTYGNHDAGIGLRGGARCELITDNESYENGAAGIGLSQGARVGEISRNDLHHNALAGIGHEGSSAGRIVVRLESTNRIHHNGAAGIGIISSDVTEIRDNVIEYNAAPGITVIGGSVAGLITGNTLDYNGATDGSDGGTAGENTGGTAGLAVLGASSATIRNTTISHSGRAGIGIFDPGTSVVLENCTISNNGQCGLGPNLTVQSGASVRMSGCSLDGTQGSPNIMASGSETLLDMTGGRVERSAKPGLAASGGAIINIRDTVFDNNGTDGTRGLMIDGCRITLKGITVCNSPHHALAATNCTGSIEGCEFYRNALAAGGQITISRSNLRIVRNVLHDPAGLHHQIALLEGSDCRVYHNTIVGKADGKGGPFNQGPGDGLHVDATSRADVRNNIFSCLPRGISRGVNRNDQEEIVAEGRVQASQNCFYQMAGFSDKGIVGDKVILDDPLLTSSYCLMLHSPCIDAAELIPGVNEVFNGLAPDIGAKEKEEEEIE